jgi:hypothetical protein
VHNVDERAKMGLVQTRAQAGTGGGSPPDQPSSISERCEIASAWGRWGPNSLRTGSPARACTMGNA